MGVVTKQLLFFGGKLCKPSSLSRAENRHTSLPCSHDRADKSGRDRDLWGRWKSLQTGFSGFDAGENSHTMRGCCWGKPMSCGHLSCAHCSDGFVTLRAKEEVAAWPQGRRLEGALQRVLGMDFVAEQELQEGEGTSAQLNPSADFPILHEHRICSFYFL